MRGTQQKKCIERERGTERERGREINNVPTTIKQPMNILHATLQMIREQQPWQSIQIESIVVKNQKFN